MNGDNTPAALTGEIREEIIKILEAEHLDASEQDILIADVGSALMERASLTLMSKLPAEVLAEITEKVATENPQVIIDAVTQHVPNADEVIKGAFAEGMELYKEALHAEE